MNLILAEISYKSVTIERREKANLGEKEIDLLYEHLKTDNGQTFILSTCYRVILLTQNTCKRTVDDAFIRMGIELKDVIYFYDKKAVSHLFSVAGGLESPILGENEILGQIKKYYQKAQKNNALGAELDELLRQAIFVGKKVRTQTQIGQVGKTYPSVSFKLIKEHFTDLSDKRLLILGTGDLGLQLVNFYIKKHVKSIDIASRSLKRAKEVADRYVGVESMEIGLLSATELARYDIIIGGTETGIPIVDKNMVLESNRKDVVFVDLGLPRNFDEQIRNVSAVHFYNLTDFHKASSHTVADKMMLIPDAICIVDDQVDKYVHWLQSRKVVPIIKTINDRVDRIKEEELKWAIHKMGCLDSHQQDILERMTNRLISRIMGNSILKVKNLAQSSKENHPLETFKEIFDFQ